MHVERVTVNRPGAPIAPIRAASAGDNITREKTVSRFPGVMISFAINEVASGELQRVEIAQDRPGRTLKNFAARSPDKRNSRDMVGLAPWIVPKRLGEVQQRPLGLTQE